MKKFFNLAIQDTILLSRNWVFYALPILAIIIIVVTNFVLPKEMEIQNKEILFYIEQGDEFKEYIKSRNAEDLVYESKKTLKEAVGKDSNRLGVVVDGGIEKPELTIILQGTESETIKNLSEATFESLIRTLGKYEQPQNYKVVQLSPNRENVPFNLNMMPMFVFMEAGLLGLFLIAIMIFQEKQEGSIRAYRVSPGGVLTYLFSKIGVIVFFSVIYGLVLSLFTIGFDINYLYFIIFTILCALVFTGLGLVTSVFFNSLSDYIFIMLAMLIILTLPIMSYFSPSFSPAFIQWIPTYPVMFGYREIFFPTGKFDLLLSTGLTLLIEGVGLTVLGYFMIKAKLMKEGR